MHCRFEGPFTDEEQRCIRTRLQAMDEAATFLRLDLGEEWTLQHAVEERGRDEYRALHVESGTVFLATTACRLGREIDKAATFLMALRQGGHDA